MITCCTFDSAVINSIKSEQQVFLISVSLFLSVFLSYCICLILFFVSLDVPCCLCPSLSLCSYLSVFVFVYLCMSLPFTVSCCLVCLFLSFCVSFCLCLPLSVSVSLCLLLPLSVFVCVYPSMSVPVYPKSTTY
jgi:hypothetical protein